MTANASPIDPLFSGSRTSWLLVFWPFLGILNQRKRPQRFTPFTQWVFSFQQSYGCEILRATVCFGVWMAWDLVAGRLEDPFILTPVLPPSRTSLGDRTLYPWSFKDQVNSNPPFERTPSEKTVGTYSTVFWTQVIALKVIIVTYFSHAGNDLLEDEGDNSATDVAIDPGPYINRHLPQSCSIKWEPTGRVSGKHEQVFHCPQVLMHQGWRIRRYQLAVLTREGGSFVLSAVHVLIMELKLPSQRRLSAQRAWSFTLNGQLFNQ